MLLDLISIIAGGIVVLLSVASVFMNPFFRARNLFGKIVKHDEETEDEQSPMTIPKSKWPRISVIITAHDNASQLEQHLPTLLSQDYPGIFEVIVVAEKGDTATEETLKRYLNNRRLYYTFIPDSSRYMSRKKLAITLGVKASRYEWVLLTDASSTPLSDTWLKTFAQNMNEGNTLVVGYSNYGKDAPSYYRFEQLRTACYVLQDAKKGIAYRTNSNNIAFRKADFIGRDGYRGNLQFIRGEYDFLVNKYAERDRTAVETDTNSWIVDERPTKKVWRQSHANFFYVRKHLKHGKWLRFLYNLDTLLLHANYIIILLALAGSILTSRWIVTGVALLALIFTFTFRWKFARNVLKRVDIRLSPWKTIIYEIKVFWQNVKYYFWYLRTNKSEFSSHKI